MDSTNLFKERSGEDRRSGIDRRAEIAIIMNYLENTDIARTQRDIYERRASDRRSGERRTTT